MQTRSLILSIALVACGGHTGSPTAPVTAASGDPAWTPTSFTVKVSGAGRPVIFIPGLTCDGSVWDETLAHLGGKVEAHVLSLAGFGATPPITEPLLPTVHAELVEYIEHNHLDHPILVGHSLGGFMTLWVAETAPALIGGVVTVDGPPFIGALFDADATPDSVRADAQQMGDGMAARKPDEFAAGMAQFLGIMITGSEDRARIAAIAGKSDPKTTGAAMVFLFTTDLRPDLGKISVPTLVVAADTTGGDVSRDQIEASWQAQIKPIPHHELAIIDHARHFVMLDQPAAFYAALDRFLAAPAH
jgi:N-formylmaleamate deformylase